jgi:hypothetical protein
MHHSISPNARFRVAPTAARNFAFTLSCCAAASSSPERRLSSTIEQSQAISIEGSHKKPWKTHQACAPQSTAADARSLPCFPPPPCLHRGPGLQVLQHQVPWAARRAPPRAAPPWRASSARARSMCARTARRRARARARAGGCPARPSKN